MRIKNLFKSKTRTKLTELKNVSEILINKIIESQTFNQVNENIKNHKLL